MKWLYPVFLCAISACQSAPEQANQAAPPPKSALVKMVNDTESKPADTLPPPPVQKPVKTGYDTVQWAELVRLDSTIALDLKYATTDNFVHTAMYECGRCLLRREVAQAVVKAHHQLQKQGLGLKMFDCYRPRPIQWKLWEKVPDPRYVADPRKGSMHNRGAAVDLTLVDAQGNELDMGTPFDFFGKQAYHSYKKLPEEVLARRQLLKTTMESLGFQPTKTEWWHYAYVLRNYPLSDDLWECQ